MPIRRPPASSRSPRDAFRHDARTTAIGQPPHLSGDAFDVQPVIPDSDDIMQTIRDLPGLRQFLEKEGHLIRWHAEFNA